MQKTFLLILIFLFSIGQSISQNSTEELIQKLENTSDKKKQLEILDDITKILVKKNSKKKLTYLNKYVFLAKELKLYDAAAQKSRSIIQHYTNQGKLDSTKYIVDKMLTDKDKFTKKNTEAHLLLKRASYFFNTDQYEKAILDYNTSGDIFFKEKDTLYTADARYFAGQVYNEIDDFLNAVKYYEKAYQLYDIVGDNDYKNIVISELSALYSKNGFHDKSLIERKKNLKNAKKGRNYKFIGFAYGDLAKSYSENKNYELMNRYIDSTTFCLDSMKYKSEKNLVKLFINNLRIDYSLEKKDVKSAEIYLKKCKEIARKTSAQNYFLNNLLPYEAKIFFLKNQYAKAETVLKKVLSLKENEGKDKLIKLAEKEIAEVYAAKNNYKKAFTHLEAYLKLDEKSNNLVKNNTFLYYQSQFETQRKDNEILKQEIAIKLLEKDKELVASKRKMFLVIFISIILALASILYFVWKRGKLKRKALAKKLAKNKKSLEEFTNQLLEKRRVQELLTKEIERLNEEIGEINSSEDIQNLTSVKILTNEDWYTFKEKFINVYPSFFREIKQKGYSLTKAEERLLALEKLFLDTNQIASMLAISNDSVTKSRSRLRKKINAPKGISILNYLEAS